MKIRATEEQGYFSLNGMAITTGKVYDVLEEPRRATAVVVVGDDGGGVWLLPDEFIVEEE